MIYLTLREQILQFVKTFGVVEEKQILSFFRKQWGEQPVINEVTRMKHIGKLIEHPQNRISTVRRLPTRMSNYDPVIRALHFMMKFDSEAVDSFFLCNYPNEIFFVVEEVYSFQVTVFDYTNWVSKYSMVPAVRNRAIPKNAEDPTQYVAVVPDLDMIRNIKPLGIYTLFAIVDKDGNCELCEF